MSGGSFDYACYRATQFADELRNKLTEQGKPRAGGWGDNWPEWPADVAATLAQIADTAEHAGRLMKEAEWLYSGDIGEDTFRERVAAIRARGGEA